MATPSAGTFLIIGNLGLRDGVVTRPYTQYRTGIPTSSYQTIPATIRVFTRSSSTVLAHDTVAFVIAKAHAAANQTVVLDALLFEPFPGDPSLDSYDYAIPVMDPVAFVTGHVATTLAQLGEEADKLSAFNVSTNDWVISGIQDSTLQFVFDKKIRRWENPPFPVLNSCVTVLGQAFRLSSEGHMSFKVISIALALGARAAPPPPAHDDGGGSPAKRRRFAPSTPASTSTASTSTGAQPSGSGTQTQTVATPTQTHTSPSCPTSQAGPLAIRHPSASFRTPSPPAAPNPRDSSRTCSPFSPVEPTIPFTHPSSSTPLGSRATATVAAAGSPLSEPSPARSPPAAENAEVDDDDMSYVNLVSPPPAESTAGSGTRQSARLSKGKDRA